jgi:type II secretory pathway component GspD/PulD (secretin)
MRVAAALLLCLALDASAQGLAEGGAAVRRSVIDVAADDEPIRDVLRRIADQTGARLVVGPEVDRRVSLRLRQVSWPDAVRELTRRAKLTVEELPGGVLRVTQPSRVVVQLQEADVQVALLLLARYAGRSVVIGPDVRGRISLELRDVTWDQALRAVASLVEAAVVAPDGPSDLVVVGARAGAVAPTPGDQAVVEGTFVERRRDGDRELLVLRRPVQPGTPGGPDVSVELPAPGPAREAVLRAIEGVQAGARLVVASGPDGRVRHVVVTR